MMEKDRHDRRIYLDNAATTRPLPEVILTMGQVMYDVFGNPSSGHADGRDAKATVEQARREIASLIGAKHSQLFFTSGGTESDSTVLQGARAFGIRRIVSSRAEHHAVTSVLRAIEKENDRFSPEDQVEVVYIGLDEKGRLSAEGLDHILGSSDRKTLVSLMHANNETGNMYDIAAIGQVCRTHGALFHTDAVQTVGHLPLDLSGLEVDFLSASAHKFHGPKGVGFLYVREPGVFPAWLLGGGQERGMRSGTENVAGIAGMACALRLAAESMEADAAYVRHLKNRLTVGLSAIDGIRFNGLCREDGRCLPGIVNVTLPVRKDISIVLLALDMKGVEVSAGSACMAGAPEPSAVLGEMYKYGDGMPGCPSVRLSLCRFNTPDEVDAAVLALKSIL